MKSSLVIVTLCGFALLLTACGADKQYATPEVAAATYAENGPGLQNAIDLAAWNFVWYGMSQSSQKWFTENWEKICERPGCREACGQQGIEKAKIVAFGCLIAPRGPARFAAVKEVKKEGKTAIVTFEGWDGELHLKQEERGNWRIDGLFGIEETDPGTW